MKKIADYKFEIEFYEAFKGYFWMASAIFGKTSKFYIVGESYNRTEQLSKKNWEVFAKTNRIKNWRIK